MSTITQRESDQREATAKTETQRRPPYRLSVAKYEAMVASGAFTKADRFELIEGALVEKMTKGGKHSASSERSWRAIHLLLPPGWHVRIEKPVRIPQRDSEPEPDVSVARGGIDDYEDRHPGPEDVALVVEVAESTLADDRAMAVTYGGGGIPVYWIVNVAGRQLEVYANPIGGAYPAPTILGETESVELIIEGQVVGMIAVAKLLPRAKGGAS
ncbi:MAG TPA: Uma2 family endonuclease [Isosphaeraceae bacterium]|nr:Uma2 family endonuclease [Isosphaeraceae bacterium]